MNKNGGWIFIFHSHLDIDIVRRIRNKLEDRGFEPLMFFLKCTLFDKGSFFVVNSLRIVAGFFGLAPKVAQTPIERCLTHAAHSKNSFK